MGNNITEKLKYKESVVKFSYKYGVTKAAIKFNECKINLIRYKEKTENREFMYITDLPMSNKNLIETIGVGRKRWKIENVGFNIQKNGTFDIGHLYSKNQTAIKVHYLMVQIAHIIRQLLENGSSVVKAMKMKLKEISLMLLKELISKKNKLYNHNKIQLRFYD